MLDDFIPNVNVFPFLDFANEMKTLEVYPTVNSYEGMYDFKVTVTYENHPEVQVYAYFSIDIKACASHTLNADPIVPSIWQDDSYYILDEVKTLSWTP